MNTEQYNFKNKWQRVREHRLKPRRAVLTNILRVGPGDGVKRVAPHESASLADYTRRYLHTTLGER